MVVLVIDTLLDFSVELAVLVITALAFLVRRVINILKRLEERMSRIEEEISVSSNPDVEDTSRIDAHESEIRDLNETQDKMLRYLTGDPDDPGNDGLLAELDNLREMMQRIEQRLEMNGAFDTQNNPDTERGEQFNTRAQGEGDSQDINNRGD